MNVAVREAAPGQMRLAIEFLGAQTVNFLAPDSEDELYYYVVGDHKYVVKGAALAALSSKLASAKSPAKRAKCFFGWYEEFRPAIMPPWWIAGRNSVYRVDTLNRVFYREVQAIVAAHSLGGRYRRITVDLETGDEYAEELRA